VPDEQQQVTNIYDCSTDSMHFLRGEDTSFFIEVEYVVPCTQTKHIVEGYGVGVATVFWPPAAMHIHMQREVPEDVLSLRSQTWQQVLYIDLLQNRIRLELRALLD